MVKMLNNYLKINFCLLLIIFSPFVQSAETLLTKITPVRNAPEFSLQDLDGNIVKLSDFRGKPLIVNFWATWCPPCRKEMPSMERAWQIIKDQGIAMVAINVGEDEDTVFTFTADYPLSFPLLLDTTGSVTQRWPVVGLPTTFIVNPEGKIVYRAIGEREWDMPELLNVIRQLKK